MERPPASILQHLTNACEWALPLLSSKSFGSLHGNQRRPARSRLQSDRDAHDSNALSGRTRIERQLRTSALRLPGKRRGNHAATDRPAFKIERFGIRVGVDGDFRGPAASRGFESVRKKRPADAQVHESRQDPEIVELPRTTQGGKRVETGDFNSDHCDKGGPRANALRRYGQLGTPALQSFGRITPVRLGLHGQRRKEQSLGLYGRTNVHRGVSPLGQKRAWTRSSKVKEFRCHLSLGR